MNCKPVTCPDGSEFPVIDVGVTVESIANSFAKGNKTGDVCQYCNFDMATCPIYDKLCPKSSDLRLVRPKHFFY